MADARASMSLRPIRDSAGARVCTLAGIGQAEDQLVELTKVKAGLDIALRDLETQGKKDLSVARVFMVLKWTKLTCDAFIGMAAVFSGEAGKEVKAWYGVGDVVADTATKAALGQKVDYVGAGLTAAKKGVALLPVEKSTKYLTKSGVIKTELIVNAINAKQSDVLKSAGEYMQELLGFTLESLKAVKTKAFQDLAKETFTYHQKLADVFEESLANEESLRMTQVQQKATLISVGRRLQAQIDKLDDFIQSCSAELDTVPVTSSVIP